MTKKYWFRRKHYGWGWSPSSWEGWGILVAFVLISIHLFRRFDAVSHSNSDTLRPFIISLFLLFIPLIAICYIKGEPPRWQWGDDKETTS